MRSILVENGERAIACMYEFADEVVYMCDYNEYHYFIFIFFHNNEDDIYSSFQVSQGTSAAIGKRS